MRITRKVLSMILALVMVVGLLPAAAFATGADCVYISVSDDGQFVADPNGDPLANRAVSMEELSSVDLDTYGLSDYLYDANGDGSYDLTALHLYIYIHTQVLGYDWSEVTVTGGAGSIYFAGGLFGFSDENLRYNYNGAYPADENDWGFTADRIVLSAGDFFDIAHYSDWNFYMDSAYGFHYFTDESGSIQLSYSVEPGTALPLNLILVGGGMGMAETITPEAGYTVYYGESMGNAAGSVTTDDSGAASVTFSNAGTYYVWCDGGEGVDMAAGAIVSAPACATVTVSAQQEAPAPEAAQDVSGVLNATMAQLAATVTAPAFGTNAGEWTVLCLARGGYYGKDNVYFADYYDRIVETVNTTAAKVNLSGALHKSKSTDNSRLIVALSAIGKDATSVGNWDLVEAYSANGFSWIKKQGINGAIWALIALDSNDYATTDTTIRQQCVDYILSMQKADGGWTLAGTTSDPDITGMTLQALYPYRDQEAVATACEEAFTCLSKMQLENGGFPYGNAETSESAAQVIVACATWGINPDTDSRFVKNGKSAVDALLAHYLESEATFEHQAGAGANAMATDQACYALVAYDRLLKNKTALYDYSDVTFESSNVVAGKPTATLGLPAQVTDDVGKTFNAVVTVDQWDNTAGYKLVDMVMNVPEGLSVTAVSSSRLSGGAVSYHLDEGKLRVVYFDANNHSNISVVGSAEGNAFPAQLFTVTFRVDAATEGDKLNISIGGMSIKLTSDSQDENAMVEIDTAAAAGVVDVVRGISYSAVCLYTGDDIDLIPATKKAVAVSVVGIEAATKLTYNDGTNEYVFKHSTEISQKTGVATYVALVDASVAMEQFVNKLNFTLTEDAASEITFGDANGDGVINAQDALAAVDAWLRKGEAPTDDQILVMNVNSDSRINTFDALGIVEKFIAGRDFGIVTKAATVTTQQ